MTVPYRAVLSGRKGASELNTGYFFDGCHIYRRKTDGHVDLFAAIDME